MRLFLVLIFLYGCGGGDAPPSDNHGYGWHYDATGKQGLKLRKAGATDNEATSLEALAQIIENCAGIDTPPPPFVIAVPPGSLGPNIFGRYFRDPPLVVLDEIKFDIAYPHEALHYILDAGTGDPDVDHTSSAFKTCVVI